MKIKQRIVSGILSLAMLLPMVPTDAFAVETEDPWLTTENMVNAANSTGSAFYPYIKNGVPHFRIKGIGNEISYTGAAFMTHEEKDGVDWNPEDYLWDPGFANLFGAIAQPRVIEETVADIADTLVNVKGPMAFLQGSTKGEPLFDDDIFDDYEVRYFEMDKAFDWDDELSGTVKVSKTMSKLPDGKYDVFFFVGGAAGIYPDLFASVNNIDSDANMLTLTVKNGDSDNAPATVKTATTLTLNPTNSQAYKPGGVEKPTISVKASGEENAMPSSNYISTWYENKNDGTKDEPNTDKKITTDKLETGKYWATVAMTDEASAIYENPKSVMFEVSKATPHVATAPTYTTEGAYYVGDSFPGANNTPLVQHSASVNTTVAGAWSFVTTKATNGEAATEFKSAASTTVYPLFTPSDTTNYNKVVLDGVTFTNVKDAEQTVEAVGSTAVDVAKGNTETLTFQYKKNGVVQETQNDSITVVTTDTNTILETTPSAVKSFDKKTGNYTVEAKVKADATTNQTATVAITAPAADPLAESKITFTIKAVDKITPFVTYNGADWKDDHYEKMHSANNALTVSKIQKTNTSGEDVTSVFGNKYTVQYQSGADWSDKAPMAPGKYKVRIEVTDSTLKDTYAQYSAETDYWIKGEVAKATGVKGETTTAGDLKITFTEPGNKTGIKNYTVKLFANNVTDFAAGTPIDTKAVELNSGATGATFTVDGTTIKAGTSYKAVVVSNVVDADTDLYTAATSDVAVVSPKLATIMVSVDKNSQTVAYGYLETEQYVITVTNTSSIAVKNAKLPALDSNFEAVAGTNVTSGFNLAANGSKTFTIKAKSGLTAKTYTMFASGAKVTGDNIADTDVPTATLKVSVVQPQITVTAPSGNITAKFGSQHTIKFTTDADALLTDTDFTITTTGSGVKSADTKPTWNTDHWEFKVTLGDSANQAGQIKIQSKSVDGKFSASDAKTIDVTTTAKDSIVITVSGNGDYNGNQQSATIDTITGSIASDKYDIEYYHAGGKEWTKTAPTNAGKHKVRIALKDATLEETYNKYSSEADFEITPAVISLSSLTFEKPYDGEKTLSKLTEVKTGLTKESDGTYTIATGVGSEKVAVTEITGAFADAAVGSGKSVSVSEFTLADYGTFKAVNYKLGLPETIGGSGEITAIDAKVKLSTDPVEVSYNGTSLTIDDLASLVEATDATALELKLSTVAGTLSLAWDATTKTFHDAANKITVTLYDSSYAKVESFTKFGSEKTYYADVAVAAMSDASYTVDAFPAQNAAPTAETLANYVTLKSTKENTGGGGGGGGGGASSVTSYTVTYKAGEHGKLSATSEKVEKDKYPSKVPTVTPDAGYRFLGWTMDGKTTVDPTSVKITKSVTFTAIYEEGEAQPELPESTLEFDKENIIGGYMNGYPDKTFGPMRNMTRAEVAAMISRVLTTHMEEGKDYDTSMYSDIKDSDWYRNSVGFLTENHVITGYTDGTFGGERTITRAEFIAMVIRVDGVLNGENPYSDVAASDWAYDYIVSGTQKGFIEGYPDGTFGGGRMITRAEATTLMNRVLGVNASNAEMPFSDVLPGFWAYGDINNAASR